MSADVELDRVTIRFGDFTAVQVRNAASINNGEFFCFLGPSGCGKTTILRTVSGFLDPSEGKVRIGGQDMAGHRPQQAADRADLPEPGAVPADDGGRQHHLWPARARRCTQAERDKQGRRAAVADRPAAARATSW